MNQAIRVAINNSAEVSQDDSGPARFFVEGVSISKSAAKLRFAEV